jgi:selenocysteine lyase/cysteine desulfurase
MKVPSLSCQKDKFDLDEDIVYLNCAYQSPLSYRVVQAGMIGVSRKAKPNRILLDDFFEPLEELKATFADLIDCDDPQRIAFQPSASYGFACIAKNLPLKKGGNLVIPSAQFPSNYYAYQEFASSHELEIRIVPPPLTLDHRGERWNKALLDAIDEKTICVSTDHVHWQDGTIFDLVHLREKSSRHDALLVIDGTQSVGALPLSVQTIKPDALVCAGYKFLMGPFSSALTYFGPYFDQGNPIEYNWINRLDSDDFASLTNYQPAYRAKAYRYNVGECSNFIQIPMLTAAITQILEWQVPCIQNYLAELNKLFLAKVSEKGYLFENEYRANHLFGIYKKGLEVKSLAKRLQQENISVSARGEVIRVSPHVYNTIQDLDKLANVLV